MSVGQSMNAHGISGLPAVAVALAAAAAAAEADEDGPGPACAGEGLRAGMVVSEPRWVGHSTRVGS